MLKALYVDMYVYMFIYVRECVDACRGQKLMSATLNNYPPYFMKQGLSHHLPDLARLDSREPQGPSCALLFSSGTTTQTVTHGFYYIGIGDPNSGPQTYMASTLSIKPSTHPLVNL